jgi:hypothetical protein
MELIKNKLAEEPDNVVRASFLELAKKGENGVPVSTGIHYVKLLRGETGVNKDYKTQKDVEGIWLFFEEDGIEKKYFVPEKYNDKNNEEKYGKFYYLYERFADIPEGSNLEMQFVKKGMAGYIDVKVVNDKIDTDDIPVINDGTPDIDVKDIPF